jgi:hypothetical protein
MNNNQLIFAINNSEREDLPPPPPGGRPVVVDSSANVNNAYTVVYGYYGFAHLSDEDQLMVRLLGYQIHSQRELEEMTRFKVNQSKSSEAEVVLSLVRNVMRHP